MVQQEKEGKEEIQGSLVHLAPLVLLGQGERLVLLDLRGREDSLGNLDHLVQLVKEVKLVLLDLSDQQDLLEEESEVNLDYQVPRALQDLMDQQGHLDLEERVEKGEGQDLQDHQVICSSIMYF